MNFFKPGIEIKEVHKTCEEEIVETIRKTLTERFVGEMINSTTIENVRAVMHSLIYRYSTEKNIDMKYFEFKVEVDCGHVQIIPKNICTALVLSGIEMSPHTNYESINEKGIYRNYIFENGKLIFDMYRT